MSTLVLNPAAAVPASAAAAAASSQLAADCEHFSKLCCNKAPSPHFLALFSRNQWNVKWPVYGKKGFYRLTSGRFNRAKCAVSARSRLNSPWLVGCFSLLCVGGVERNTHLHICIMNDLCQLQIDYNWPKNLVELLQAMQCIGGSDQ